MNILLAGVGGQGTVLTSRLLAQCGIDRGLSAHTAETIGMAQRGGSVISHVRLGEGMFSPLIPKGTADLLIGFEPAEAVRNFDYLKHGGTVVVSSRAIRPTTSLLSDTVYDGSDMLDYLRKAAGRLVVVNGDDIAKKSSARALNIALLGAALGSGAFDSADFSISENDISAAMKKLMAMKFYDANMTAFRLGMESANK